VYYDVIFVQVCYVQCYVIVHKLCFTKLILPLRNTVVHIFLFDDNVLFTAVFQHYQ